MATAEIKATAFKARGILSMITLYFLKGMMGSLAFSFENSPFCATKANIKSIGKRMTAENFEIRARPNVIPVRTKDFEEGDCVYRQNWNMVAKINSVTIRSLVAMSFGNTFKFFNSFGGNWA